MPLLRILSVPFSLMQNDLFYSLSSYAYLYISFMQLYIYLSVFFYTMNYAGAELCHILFLIH